MMDVKSCTLVGRGIIIIYIPLSRVGKGWKVNIREFHFPVGFRDFFMLFSIPSVSEGWNKHEKVEKPQGEMKFLIFIFHHVQPLKKVYM